MLSEEKIRIMTGIAMFEKKSGKKIFPQNRCFKNDYIAWHMIAAFFGYTLCWCLGAVLWILYKLEELLNQADITQLFGSVKAFGIAYLVGLILYLVIIRQVYKSRYEYANGGIRVYTAKLKRLQKRYDTGGRSRTNGVKKEGIPHDGTSDI